MKRFLIGLCVFLMVGMSWEVGAFDKEHIKKLKALGSCPSCDLSNANLRGADLDGADLTGANLTIANLTEANLFEADLEWAFLLGANLKGANLYWSDLSKEIFCDTTMSDGTINNSGC